MPITCLSILSIDFRQSLSHKLDFCQSEKLNIPKKIDNRGVDRIGFSCYKSIERCKDVLAADF